MQLICMHGSRFANVDFSTDEQSHNIVRMILPPESMLTPSPKKLQQDIQCKIKHRFQLQKPLKEKQRDNLLFMEISWIFINQLYQVLST